MLQLLFSATANIYVNFKCYSFYAQLLRYFPQASMLGYSCFVFGYVLFLASMLNKFCQLFYLAYKSLIGFFTLRDLAYWISELELNSSLVFVCHLNSFCTLKLKSFVCHLKSFSFHYVNSECCFVLSLFSIAVRLLRDLQQICFRDLHQICFCDLHQLRDL